MGLGKLAKDTVTSSIFFEVFLSVGRAVVGHAGLWHNGDRKIIVVQKILPLGWCMNRHSHVKYPLLQFIQVQRRGVRIRFKPRIRRPVLKLKRMAVIFLYGVITRIVGATSPGLSYMLIYLRRVAAQKRGSSLDLIRVTRRSRRFYAQGILRDSADSVTFLFEKTIQPPTVPSCSSTQPPI